MIGLVIMVSVAIAPCVAARAQYHLNEGDRAELSLPGNIKTWTRVRFDGGEEFIKYCVLGQHSPYCTHFVSTSDGSIIEPATEATVFSNGTLVIQSVKQHDSGFYSSHDEPENIHVSEDGKSMWATPRSQIVLTVE